MTTTVLVPLDGSDRDARALAVAVAFAHLADGALHLVRVREAPAGDRPATATTDGDEEQSLRAAADTLAPVAGRPVTWEVLQAADVAATLRRRADELDAVLVVMATRAPGPVGRAVRGSVADLLVREGSRPVVLVPPGAEHVAGKRIQIARALVPLDESDAARDMVSYLLGLPGVAELEWVLLQVVSAAAPVARRGRPTEPAAADHAADAEPEEEEERPHAAAEAAELRLHAVADRLRARGAAVDVRVVEADDPAAVIGDAVRQELVDCIAISTRGTRGLERLLLGSVADGVVRRAEVPVLLRTPAM